MTADDQSLPPGTDTTIDLDRDEDIGTAIVPTEVGNDGNGAAVRDQFRDRYDALRGQAGDKARDVVQAGKDRATAALDDVVRMIEDAADEVDAKLGGQYGDYARRAAQGIGDFSESFKGKDVDELFDDARALIQKSPGIAIGVAAALGFVAARLARSAVSDGTAGDAPQA